MRSFNLPFLKETHLSYKKGVPKNFPLTFLIRKVSKRISHRIHRFIVAKVFEVSQETFYKKFLVSGFGADSPNIQCTQKARQCRAFLFFRNMLELRSKPCFKGLLKKSLKNPQNFRTEHTHLLWRSF